MLEVAPLRAIDRQRWEVLARGYKAFYETALKDDEYERAWKRLLAGDSIRGLGASEDGVLVGIAHFFHHPSIWMADACHLQDLYVDESVRGRGVARALIEGVAEVARARGASRYYWHTRANNRVARALYDKVARHDGFIRYDYDLAAPAPD